jgi:hypothetical protein
VREEKSESGRRVRVGEESGEKKKKLERVRV